MITKENIFKELAKGRYLEVLKSDLVYKVKDSYGWTPLHELAWKGVEDILHHPSIDKVKDYEGRTPLHILAYNGIIEVLDHPSINKVKDNTGMTPLHFLANGHYLTKDDLRKKYPWYKKEIKDIRKAVDEIVDTPASVKFILED